jgi:hypothetical protein
LGFVPSIALLGLTTALSVGVGAMSRPDRPLAEEQRCTLTISARPAVTITSTDKTGLFYRITGGVFVDGGGIVIVSSGTQAVLAFSREGRFERTFGRKGEGPGEFRFLSGLWRFNDSTLMVSDNPKARVTLFNNALDNARSVALQSATGVRWPVVVGVAGGSIVAINGQAFERGQMGVGTVRPPYQFLRYSAAGVLRDTLMVLAGREFHVPQDNTARPTRATPLGADVLFAASDSGLHLLSTDGGRITRVRQRNREEAFATLPIVRQRLTAADVARYKAAQRADAVTPAQHRDVALLDEIPFPQYFPSADGLLVDGTGAVWARRVAAQPSERATWERVSRDGRTQCTAHIPASVRLLDADADRVLGVMTDGDGEESIVIYTVSRS